MKDVKMRGFKESVRVDDALRKYLEEVKVKALQHEVVPISEALHRVLAEDVIAEVDVPHFDRSAVDGYAVKSDDTYGASPENPVVFDVIGVSEVGKAPEVAVGRLQAVRIATGAPLPEGADSVVMLEYTERISEDRVEVYMPATPWDNVSRKGEDVEKGEKILSRGTVLQPQDLAILASIGLTKVKVVKKPRVAVLSTGDELVEPGGKIEFGKVIDVNRLAIAASVEEAGGKPLDLGIAGDEINEIKSKASEGLKIADMVLVSGGASVGAKDLAPDAIDSLGKPGIIVHSVSMRPGKPVALAAVNGKPVIILPGNPVAAMMAFNVFAKPVIARMLGTPTGKPAGHVIKAKMARRVPSSAGAKVFLRVIVKKVEGGYVAEPVRTSGAGIISSMVKANGLVVIPEEKEGIEEGEEVEVTLLRPLEE